jgi:hypothetical protein
MLHQNATFFEKVLLSVFEKDKTKQFDRNHRAGW